MLDERVQGTIELNRPPNEAPDENLAGRSPFDQRVFSLRNIASVLLPLIILCLACRELLDLDWHEVWVGIERANVGLFALAFAVFYGSFAIRSLRWRILLGNVGYSRAASYSMPSTIGLGRIMYLAWFANCLTIAQLGDVYRGYLLKKASNVSFTVTLGTILAERLLDLMVLGAMLAAGLLVLFHGSLPTEVTQVLAGSLILSFLGVVGLLSVRRFRKVFERIVPKRLHAYYFSLEHGLVGSFRQLPLLIFYSAIGWVIEGVTLYLVTAAVGHPVPVADALVVALVVSLLTTIPVTPGGLGYTEAGLVLMLGWLGIDVYTAGAITLLFRIITYWSIVVFGFILFVLDRNAG
jgi:uncharacterized protein (TIRG00374 family)